MEANATPRLLLGAMIVAAAVASGPAAARETVDLELVLAVDTSRSMDYEEQIIQRNGYVAAFRSKEVIDAILSGGLGRIAVVYMEWASDEMTRVVVPWTLIDSAEAAHAFAGELEKQRPQRMSRTSISGALVQSQNLFGISPWQGMRRVVDVSGDGPNNHGLPVEAARDEIVAQGIVVNGLPLMVREAMAGYGIDNLDDYYTDCVIGGTGSFVIPVDRWEAFEEAVRRKLVLEIAGAWPTIMPAAVTIEGERPKVDCMIGEKLWLRRMQDFELR
ncbi:MAG: hypothetical protein BroJett030_08560 [Alphaproteobacteria bacterium]|nr:MAG: hypothetical protein BroJett030_08560 [Alphaproteobacteria bacterium]